MKHYRLVEGRVLESFAPVMLPLEGTFLKHEDGLNFTTLHFEEFTLKVKSEVRLNRGSRYQIKYNEKNLSFTELPLENW